LELSEYSYAGQSPEVKQQIVEMAMNASGVRDTARVLHISPNTVMAELKKALAGFQGLMVAWASGRLNPFIKLLKKQ